MSAVLFAQGLFVCTASACLVVSYPVVKRMLAKATLWVVSANGVKMGSVKSYIYVDDKRKVGIIHYPVFAEDHSITVPYSRKHVVGMSQFRAQLLVGKYLYEDITQQPGIPYSFSARALGGDSIKITDEETGRQHTFGADEIPGYAEMLMDLE